MNDPTGRASSECEEQAIRNRRQKRRSKSFLESPALGIWSDREESDEELLNELGSGWEPPPKKPPP